MVSDATGSASKEKHEAGLKAWGFGYGDVIDTEEVLRRLGWVVWVGKHAGMDHALPDFIDEKRC
jgi:hypothetical protein